MLSFARSTAEPRRKARPARRSIPRLVAHFLYAAGLRSAPGRAAEIQTMTTARNLWLGGQEEDLKKSRDAGFDRHMVKPVDYAALMKLLAELQPVGNAS